jgi:hypothetical protein
MLRALLPILFLAAAHAQPLRVFSEFARIGADGEPVSPESPREILSPAVARNAYATYQIVVKAGQGTASLWVGQNPENSFLVTLYRERGGKLIKVEEPVDVKGTEVVWMDVFVSRDTPPARIKLEPELFLDNDWVIYPMEVRVEVTALPDVKRAPGTAPAMDVMRSFVCGAKLPPPPRVDEPTRASLAYRNATAELALAEQAPKAELQRLVGPCNAPPPSNPETYLRIRDYLLRLR